MAKKKQIKPGDTVTLKLTEEQADLIVEHTLINDDLPAIIHHSKLRDGVVSVRCTLEDLEELSGYLAAKSNNTKDKRLQQRFDVISDAIDELNLSYSTDTSAAPPMVKRHLSLVRK
jgi:hypothetical protein